MDLANLNNTIRVDLASNKGSIIDVIRLVNPNLTSANATTMLKRLVDDNLITTCDQLRINGKGKKTPCADAKTLVEIVWSLPGKAAREFRRTSAKTVCRVLGGDLTLVDEIEARHHALQASEGGRAVQEFLASDESSGDDMQVATSYKGDLPVELQLANPAQKSAYFDVWMKEREMQAQVNIRERVMNTQLNIVKQGVELLEKMGVADDRDRIACGDLIRRVMSAPGPSNSNAIMEEVPEDDPAVPTPECHPAHRGHEISMHSIASELGVRIPRGKEGLVGKAMKRLYAEKYGLMAAHRIPKRNVPYHGQIFPENCYWSRDEGIVKAAIREVLA